MFADDDEAEESATGATRYPVMPSLVALQQMRTRLHMAQLGRKLMKWTSVAAAAELRRISADLQSVYKTFAEDMKEAFILLARSRYFFPDLNKMVVNDIQKGASVTVASNTKTVSGVRLIQYRIVETNTPYDYLGLGTGGETIEEAKKAWVKLLKLQILMVELRRSFLIVEEVHKTATKRLNVIKKIVIPRTKASMKYIQLELEEIAREELHRIKKIQAFKRKKKDEGKQQTVRCKTCHSPMPTIKESKVPPPPKPTAAPSPAPIPPPKVSVPCMDKPSELIAVHEPSYGSRKEMFKPDKPCKVTRANSPISHISLGDAGISKLEHLKEMLDHTISLGQDVAKTETESKEIDEILQLCREAKERLDLYESKEQETDNKLAEELEHLKLHVRDVIDLTRGLRNVTFLSPSMENFIQTCEQVDEKLKLAIINVETAKLNEGAKTHLLDLKDEINDVLKVIAAYKDEGLLTQSAEEFAKVCKETKSKIDCYTKEAPSEKELKLEHLKSHIDTLETITTDVKREGLRSASIEKFLASCKDFKDKIEEYKTGKKRERPVGKQVSKLISQIDTTLKTTQAVKQEGLVSGSVDKFIKSCESLKTRLVSKSKESQKPLSNLKSDDEVLNLISNLRSQGLITESTENFLRTCEDAKNRLDLDSVCSVCAQSKSILSPECGGFCTCQSDALECDKCKESNEPENTISVTMDLSPLCNTCQGIAEDGKQAPCRDCNAVFPPDPKQDSKQSACKACTSKPSSTQTSEMSCTLCNAQPAAPVCPVGSVEPVNPEKCCASVSEATSENKQNEDDGEELGVFEKKVRTITKITRYKTETGDIREEKEVTTIKKMKHDPNQTDMDSEDYESVESFDVGVCITPTQNQMGFRNLAIKSKSEEVMRESSLTRPHFRQCVSFNPQVCLVRTPSQNFWMDSPTQLSSTTSLCLFQTSFF